MSAHVFDQAIALTSTGNGLYTGATSPAYANMVGPFGGVTAAVNIEAIPSGLIQRVDTVTGGASAAYGSDAVAGVVNFVLDDKFEGASFNLGYSAYQHNNDNRAIQALNRTLKRDQRLGRAILDGEGNYEEDRATGVLYEQLMATAFTAHPYRQPAPRPLRGRADRGAGCTV